MLATHKRRRRTVKRRAPHSTRRVIALATAIALTLVIAIGAIRARSQGASQLALPTAASATLAPNTAPRQQPLAQVGQTLTLDVPITQRRITAIVYHGVGNASVIPLDPIGRQLNASFISRLVDRLFGSSASPGPGYYVDGSATGVDTGSVDIGAPAGTAVYSPVSGTVVSVRPYELSGKTWGDVIQIRPDAAPAITVTITNLATSAGSPIQVGAPVTAARSRLGTVIDLSGVISQTLAHYTTDAGNHVAIQLGRAPGASPLL